MRPGIAGRGGGAGRRIGSWRGIVGAAGLEPTLAAVRQGRMVAFANKEVLVSAGSLFMREVATHGATLLPVDSEHNAICNASTSRGSRASRKSR